jgi:hypothetical protein
MFRILRTEYFEFVWQIFGGFVRQICCDRKIPHTDLHGRFVFEKNIAEAETREVSTPSVSRYSYV